MHARRRGGVGPMLGVIAATVALSACTFGAPGDDTVSSPVGGVDPAGARPGGVHATSTTRTGRWCPAPAGPHAEIDEEGRVHGSS